MTNEAADPHRPLETETMTLRDYYVNKLKQEVEALHGNFQVSFAPDDAVDGPAPDPKRSLRSIESCGGPGRCRCPNGCGAVGTHLCACNFDECPKRIERKLWVAVKRGFQSIVGLLGGGGVVVRLERELPSLSGATYEQANAALQKAGYRLRKNVENKALLTLKAVAWADNGVRLQHFLVLGPGALSANGGTMVGTADNAEDLLELVFKVAGRSWSQDSFPIEVAKGLVELLQRRERVTPHEDVGQALDECEFERPQCPGCDQEYVEEPEPPPDGLEIVPLPHRTDPERWYLG